MGTIINPLLKYEVVGKWATKYIETLAIRAQGINIIGLYISPSTKAEEEKTELEKLKNYAEKQPSLSET